MANETLLGHSTIWLFGRELADIKLNPGVYNAIPADDLAARKADTPVQKGNSHNGFLLDQLEEADARFARIYAFTYQGAFYELGRPSIFLVHGTGIDPEGSSAAADPSLATLSRMPANFGRSGLASLSGSFSGSMKVWAYERADFTVRLDMESGTFDSVLLSAELGGPDTIAQSSGSVARAAGSVARAAGSVARAAGSVARARRTPDGAGD